MFNLSNLMFLDAGQITLIVVVAALLILYPIFLYIRNKKDKEKRNELYETIHKGDYVLTYSGIMGKVVEILEKQNGKFLTLQTGEGKNSGYVCVTIDAVYSFTDNKDKIFGVDGEPVKEEAKEEKSDKNKEKVEAEVVEEKVVKEEKVEKPAKKSTKEKPVEEKSTEEKPAEEKKPTKSKAKKSK